MPLDPDSCTCYWLLHLHLHLHLARKSCHNLGNWLAEVTRAESGVGKPAAEAWDQANLSVTDIGEVTAAQGGQDSRLLISCFVQPNI